MPIPTKPQIRVTQIEAFRRWFEQSEHNNFEITEQSVIDSIKPNGFTGNEYTRIGTAFHSIVESGKPQCMKINNGVRKFLYYGKEKSEYVPEGRVFNINGYLVTLDKAQYCTALTYRNEHPGAFHEIRYQKDYGDAIVSGCADMIDGLEIRDIKTKYSSYVNDIDYVDSCQWRYYLELFGADVFHFDLFCFEGYNLEKYGTDVRGLPLTRHTPAITCYRYGNLENDNRQLLSQFLEWCAYRNLTQYLKFNQEIKQ